MSTESDGPPAMKKLKLNQFECFPITSLDNISEVIENPPQWVSRVAPLTERSPTVVQNIISDCHCDAKKFGPRTRLDKRFVPKTLVCHDYKGGYLEDRFLSSSNIGNLYSFYNWQHIDIFVYFSHHLITIPPLCWINAAHQNGVKILGTLITEFEPGKKICEKIFKDEDTMRIFATSLTQILKIFQFDGWLLNIENSLQDTEMLKKFVAYLGVQTHTQNPDHLIIWYDSIIETGELKWQNELNPLNKFFFDNCDGIFLNYVWTEENIHNSIEFAKHRTLDVYVGVDVFGRNTFGGGQFNCFKAAQMIRRHNLSMAIFAPGWTHETLPKSENRQKFFEDFINRDSAFWNSLWPYLYTHPITRFFKTSFFTGVNQDVYDLFTQHPQLSKIKHPKSLEWVPNHHEIPTLNNKCNCLQCAFTSTGVRCLITKEFLNSSICYVHRIFTCDIFLSGVITIYVLTKLVRAQAAQLSLNLLTSDKNGTIRKIKCNSTVKEHLIKNCTLMEINPSINPSLVNHVVRSNDDLFLHENLTIAVYQFDCSPCTLLEIGCTLEEGKAIYLCGLGVEEHVLVL
ncbi:cytosolic endo-beta-N-acetylglucosaminidase [Tribolium castaneum]|uniref:Cytosolic endo-beta-N-acetylglucosaminidase-like Protein n=1 Tax=Tribolium castaneum TaxID=7070 RepID=D6WYZ1_TRICA|nr:PREDICTED: cytosolic endo-beta-N-acetylglucosaminidase [Tribolium castaneum]XP_008197369.1 PREDICTED: cytosolic endo-beta-N-acetylglucosaminidase [Tribolium castaneum]EFA09314.2 Cytosolic endo-beta-N-acetylglucosaminidase-like Protein [Tribolium castaneum]|eukprot:XP_008197368.1 PREDICTED: cytosolic endo-beta-N-acetylglucosaminidase [Tribolium castaneum]